LLTELLRELDELLGELLRELGELLGKLGELLDVGYLGSYCSSFFKINITDVH
jgi:hypothetical protein